MFVYLAANHFPWETRFRPDLLPNWRAPGNDAEWSTNICAGRR